VTIIECIGAPFTYRWPTGEVRLAPGHPVELPDSRVARLLEKAPGRVRVVVSSNESDGDLTGHIVTWESRLFWGEMRATVLEDLGHSVRCVHPLTDVECVIPRAWLQRKDPR
jgi:hypothetical protein